MDELRIRALLTVVLVVCPPIIRGGQSLIAVIDSGSEQPISGAVVQLGREDGILAETETGTDGKAAFPALQPGNYWVRLEKSGYADLLARQGQGRRLVVPADRENAITIHLTRTVAISGQVFDSQGSPRSGVTVTAVVRRSINGDTRIVPTGEAIPTDDGGRYRLYGLPPGHYSTAAIAKGNTAGSEVFAPVCYPGSREAEFFDLKAGEVKTSANLILADRGGVTISGTVSGIPRDKYPNRASVSLVAAGALKTPIATAWTDTDGSYVFNGVSPGEYQLVAWARIASGTLGTPLAGTDACSAVRAVSVSSGAVQVDLQLQPLARIRGRLIWNRGIGNTSTPSGTGRIVFHSEDGWPDEWLPAASVDGDRFTVDGLPAGRYRIAMPDLADSYRLASVQVGNATAPDRLVDIGGTAPLTIVLTAATGEVSGSVSDTEGKPARGVVLLSPADEEGSAQVQNADAGGRFRFSNVPEGKYRLIALETLDSTDYLDPVEALNLDGKLIKVEAGQKLTSDLRLIQR
ncbi:MAG: carboxypeptidase regulatory-like domain-containing protein [Bryobacteraceae bacterium]